MEMEVLSSLILEPSNGFDMWATEGHSGDLAIQLVRPSAVRSRGLRRWLLARNMKLWLP